jgi:hypothetical protein
MSKSQLVLITGGTGFIGRALTREFLDAGYDIVVLSRYPRNASCKVDNRVKVVQWNTTTLNGWASYADGALAIVNLAGESIGTGRWLGKKKKQILESRVNAGKAIVEAVEQAKNKPQVVIQGSAVGYYGDGGDEILSENSSTGAGFLADVCKQWEQTIQPVAALGIRLIVVRIGVVLGPCDGFLSRVMPVFRLFLGGRIGSSKQWLSWINIYDVVGAIRFLIENPNLKGIFNLTAPHPILSKDFYALLGKAMHRPVLLSVPAFMLKVLMGEMATELLLSSQRAIPKRLLQAGYRFKYVDPGLALKNIIKETD